MGGSAGQDAVAELRVKDSDAGAWPASWLGDGLWLRLGRGLGPRLLRELLLGLGLFREVLLGLGLRLGLRLGLGQPQGPAPLVAKGSRDWS